MMSITRTSNGMLKADFTTPRALLADTDSIELNLIQYDGLDYSFVGDLSATYINSENHR